MKKNSVSIYPFVFPPIPSPTEALYKISTCENWIKPKIVSIDQPYIGESVHAATKISRRPLKAYEWATRWSSNILASLSR
jgi:hypothetical protein